MHDNQPVISPEAFHGLFGRITDALDPYTEGSKVGVYLRKAFDYLRKAFDA